ncbi:hypothetical protein ACN265_01125 [Micromonospora sp. WMMD730]|uniref:hypothetical protein n=1 Tax=Micromonospora sp. WMMD730 TaxID=3404128 RepID=UPI003B95846D
MPKRRPAGPGHRSGPTVAHRPPQPTGPRLRPGLPRTAGPVGPRRLLGRIGLLPAVVATVLATGCAVADVERTSAPTPTPVARTLRTPDTLLGLPRSGTPLPAGLPRFRLNELTREATPATSTVEAVYGRGRRSPETIVVSAVSGTVPDPQAMLDRLLKPYRIPKPRSVEFGRYGGEARCGRGRTADEGHLTACAWADPEVAGVVVFLTATKQPDRKEDFLTIRDELEQTTG